MKNVVSFAVVIGLVLAGGCGKSDKDKAAGGGGGGGGGGGKGAKPYQLKIGPTVDLPSDVDTSSESMLTGPSIGAMTIDEASTKQTLDEAKADADMYSPKNVKGEALPDGWVLTFDNSGEMGASFFLQVQRDIGGKTFKCSTTQPNGERINAVLAVCKSLRN